MLPLKRNAINQAMEKVMQIIEAKKHMKHLTGQNNKAYAAIILRLVAEELQLPIKLKDIIKASNHINNPSGDPTKNLKNQSLQNASKKLKKVFKEWFRNENTPSNLMPKKCTELGYPQSLADDAQKFIELIQLEGKLEGCQCSTIVGVALYYLNQRLDKIPLYKDYKKSADEIAEVVKIGVQTIKEKADRIRNDVIYLLPKAYLDPAELNQRIWADAQKPQVKYVN